MYKVYVIKSKVDNRLYVGMTQNLTKRLEDHNKGRVFSTKGYRPWMLVYKEDVSSNRVEARTREKYLKNGSGKEYLKAIIQR